MTHITCRLTARNRDQLRNPIRSVIEYGLPFLPCSYRIVPYLYSRLVFSIGLHSGVYLCCPYCVLRYTVVFAQVEYTRHLYVFAMRSPLVNFYYARTGQVRGLFTEA